MPKQFPDMEWDLSTVDSERIGTWEKVQVAVLMDIRREVRALNRLLSCSNFLGIPRTLRSIERNTKKPPRKKKEESKK